VRLDLTREAGRASFVAVDTVLSPAYRTLMVKRMGLVRAGGAVAFA
jgi:alkaline phosphatase D